MDVAVVYESLFGNTRIIAEAIAEGLQGSDPEAQVAVMGVDEATPDKVENVGLLVVGAPTHIGRMPTARSRKQFTTSPGVREWLEDLPSARTRAKGGRLRYAVWLPAIRFGSTSDLAPAREVWLRDRREARRLHRPQEQGAPEATRARAGAGVGRQPRSPSSSLTHSRQQGSRATDASALEKRRRDLCQRCFLPTAMAPMAGATASHSPMVITIALT